MNKRMEKEFNDLKANPLPGVTVAKTDLPNKWQVTIAGPEGTVFSGHKFIVNCIFPENYPFKMPDFVFETLIWHPNVTHDKGEVCKEMLGEKEWVPTKQVRTVIDIISNMLAAPNNDSAINHDASKQFKENLDEFNKHATEYIKKYCVWSSIFFLHVDICVCEEWLHTYFD